MLTHIVPPAANRAALLQEIRAGYSGPAIVGEDLMRFDLINRIVKSGETTLAL
jgi:ribonuclease Z